MSITGFFVDFIIDSACMKINHCYRFKNSKDIYGDLCTSCELVGENHILHDCRNRVILLKKLT